MHRLNKDNDNKSHRGGSDSADDSGHADPREPSDRLDHHQDLMNNNSGGRLETSLVHEVNWTRLLLKHLMIKNFYAEIAAAKTKSDRIRRCDKVCNDLYNIRVNLPGIITVFQPHELENLLTQLLRLMPVSKVFQRSKMMQTIAEAIVYSTKEISLDYLM